MMMNCPKCGKSEQLDPHQRHWCKCNPVAPFQMGVSKKLECVEMFITSVKLNGGVE